MDFGKDELDLVHSLWSDETQDEDVISSETGMPKDRVLKILQILSDQGKIKDFITEKEIISFNEMLSIEDNLWLKRF